MHLKQNLTCAMHLKECIRSRREYRQRAIRSSVRIREICRCNTISFASKLYKSLVTSILLYESKTWILLADSKNRRKDPGFRNQGHEKYSPYLLLGVGCGAKSTSLWIHRNLFRRLSRDGNLHGSDMSHVMTASPKPFIRAPWRVGDTVVGRGNAGWTTSKSGHPFPCQSCSQGSPAEKTGRGSLLNRPSCSPEEPNRPRNWTELNSRVGLMRANYNTKQPNKTSEIIILIETRVWRVKMSWSK